MKQDYQVYVIENPAGKKYIGMSENVENRLRQHNEGQSKWTAKHIPWTIIWTSAKLTASEARKLENKLKRQGRGSGFYTITGLPNPNRS